MTAPVVRLTRDEWRQGPDPKGRERQQILEDVGHRLLGELSLVRRRERDLLDEIRELPPLPGPPQP